jgi:pimeloyl-ACP methyl ester carboxylesterase
MIRGKTASWRAIAGLIVAAATATALFVSSAAALRAHRADQGGPKPTIVLVHGAFADSGSWDRVTGRLQRDGYTVVVPPNPLMGLSGDSQTIADFLHTISGPIVLVGHSYGGAVITNAATGDAQVKALVYDDAIIPDQGQTVMGLTGAGSCLAVPDPSTVLNFVPFPGAPAGVVDAYVKPSVFAHCFANGLPARETAVLNATQRPLATNAFTDPSGPPAWKTIPSWAIVGTADNVIPLANQLAMAQHAGARVTEVDAPHLSLISDPAAVARVIEEAAGATG